MKNKMIVLLFLILFNIKVSAEEIVTVSSKVELNNENLSSETINKSALYVKNGDLSINDSRINKIGDGSFDNTNTFFNSAVTVYEKSKLSMNSCNIDTNGTYANGLYLDENSKNNIKKTNIITNNIYSIGIINVSADTTIDEVKIETNGTNSPAIMALNNQLEMINSNVITNNINSPLLQIDGKIEIKDSYLVSKQSEGIMAINNANIILNKVNIESNNVIPSNIDKNSKNIMFYNPENDLNDYKVVFNAKDSKINSLKGDTFNIVNVDADISLENNEIQNDDGVFLRGEKVPNNDKIYNIFINLNNQKINGDIVLDDSKKLKMELYNSSFKGAINSNKGINNIDIILSKDSELVLTNDVYVNSLTNGDYENKNIDLNGYKLFIKGEELSESNIIRLDYKNETFYLVLLIIIGIVLAFSIIYIFNLIRKNKRK